MAVVIRLDGTDITDDVIIVGAMFTTQANGVPGTCKFRMKDIDQTMDFTVGKRLTLDIDGDRVWAGYLSKVSRVYAFAAQNTSNPSVVTRLFEIDGVDINILFKRRIVVNKNDNANLHGIKYTADNTPDTTAVSDLVTKFLYLNGDDLDVSTLVENVGTINVDHPANPIAPGHDWGSTMRSITALSNGVYYIDPDRKLVLTDVDTPNAPFDLSDDPADDAVGYREAEILFNGSNMVNDMIVWGAGKGSSEMVYTREEDATSISTHGRWQAGEFRGDMYKQGTVNRRAESIVHGSAQSKRGAKDDAVQVICTVFEPGLRVSQKVNFRSAAFGYEDVLPIRRMVVTFITGERPRYQIMAGHEIDMPWGMFDIVKYDFEMPPIDPGEGNDCIDCPEIEIDIDTCIDPCGICHPFDDFENRSVSESFGVASSGSVWSTPLGTYDATGVTGGSLYVTGGTVNAYVNGVGSHFQGDFTMTSRFQPNHDNTTGQFDWFIFDEALAYYFGVAVTTSDLNGYIYLDDNVNFDQAQTDLRTSTGWDWIPGAWYIVKWNAADGISRAKVWNETDPEPDWQVTTSVPVLDRNSLYIQVPSRTAGGSAPGGASTSYIDYIDFGACGSPEELDDFNRTADSPGWGTSTSGFTWAEDVDAGGAGNSASSETTGANGRLDVYFDTGSDEPIVTLEIQEVTDAPFNASHWIMRTRIFANGRGRIGFLVDSDPALPGEGSRYFNLIADPDSSFAGQIMDTENVWHDVPGGFNQATWYLVKWEHQANLYDRVKVWEDGTTEPSSWIYNVEPGSSAFLGASLSFKIFLRHTETAVASTASLLIDYIQFCTASVTGASGGVLDDFERTGSDWERSSSGYLWTSSVGGAAEVTVDGSRGVLYTPGSPAGELASVILGAAIPNEEVADWDRLKVRTMRFQWDNIAWTASDFEYLVNWGMFRNVGTPLPSIYRLHSNGWRLRLDGSPTGGVAIPDAYWNDSTIYTWTCEWFDDGGSDGLRTTITDGTTEYTTTQGVGSSSQGTRVQVAARNTLQSPFTDSDRAFKVLDIDVPEFAKGCIQKVPSAGRVCEDFTGDGTATQFLTSRTHEYGTTDVTVNGLQYTTHQYIQVLVGPVGGGSIQGVRFYVAPVAGDQIHICYVVGEGVDMNLGLGSV